MELFRNPNIPFLKYKWHFFVLSLILSVAGLVSMGHRKATTGDWVPLGVDFRGGTLVYVKFLNQPNEGQLRTALDKADLRGAKIQRYGPASHNEMLISLEQKETSEATLDQGKNAIIKALETNVPEGKQDLNNTGAPSLRDYLMNKDPLKLGTDAPQRYAEIAQSIVRQRDAVQGGVLRSTSDLNGVVPAPVISSLEQDFFLSGFGVRNVEIVGPQVGKQLQSQARWAVLYSLAGMLIYLWARFELIYGVTAVLAVFHDVIITLGAFSIFDKEISLTVIAAILTLVGYSMNDTIVVFDRIRENLKLLRREKLDDLVDKSINQTLSRTVLTSGLTFLTVLSLFLFGGEVLHGFSFALVIGMLIGSYSSIFVAAPIMVAFQNWRARKGLPAAAASAVGRKEKVKAKV